MIMLQHHLVDTAGQQGLQLANVLMANRSCIKGINNPFPMNQIYCGYSTLSNGNILLIIYFKLDCFLTSQRRK